MMMSGKGKISTMALMALMSGMAVSSGLPNLNAGRNIDDLAGQDINDEAAAEALRKAQEKRDRKAAKRIKQSSQRLA